MYLELVETGGDANFKKTGRAVSINRSVPFDPYYSLINSFCQCVSRRL